MKIFLFSLLFSLVLNANNSYYELGELIELDEIKTSRSNSVQDVRYFMNYNGIRIGVGNEILIECKQDVNCVELLTQFNLQDVSQVTANIYLVKVSKEQDVFTLSKDLFNSGHVKYAHPNFIKTKKFR